MNKDEFKERAKETMENAREKAQDAMESAADIWRDQLDTFKKFDKTKQKIVLGVLGGVLVIIVLFIFWPRTADVTLERLLEPIAGNAVVVMNSGKRDLGKTKIILNDQYEAFIDGLPAGETTSVLVVDFRPKGNPDGAAPSKSTLPMKVTINSKAGTKTQRFGRAPAQ